MSEPFERLLVLQQLGRTYRATLCAFEARIGHNLPRWRILLNLYERGKPCPQKLLVEALHIDPGALTRQLKALEALGWISRSNDATDNRITNVILTEAGRQEVAKRLPLRAAFIDNMLGDVPEQELRALMSTLALLEIRFKREIETHASDS